MDSQPPPGIDLELYNEMREIMGDEFAELLQTFIDDTPVLLASIHESINAKPVDLVATASAAHQIKSTSASLGFLQLAQLADNLEQSGERKTNGNLTELCRQTNESFSRLRPFLQQHLP
jgi:HPt (histidine-containing phosphotransfer) domain-containing protein